MYAFKVDHVSTPTRMILGRQVWEWCGTENEGLPGDISGQNALYKPDVSTFCFSFSWSFDWTKRDCAINDAFVEFASSGLSKSRLFYSLCEILAETCWKEIATARTTRLKIGSPSPPPPPPSLPHRSPPPPPPFPSTATTRMRTMNERERPNNFTVQMSASFKPSLYHFPKKEKGLQPLSFYTHAPIK